MTNKTISRQTLLTEYQACQHDNSSTSLSYWTLAGIFIGVSSAVFGWLLYALISAASQTFSLPIAISVVGGAIIAILYLLRRWLKRVQFLQAMNYERMREIEGEVGMWKSTRIDALDRWDGLTDGEKTKLTRHRPLKWWQEWQDKSKYEHPTSKWICKRIFCILFGLWGFLILVAWFPAIRTFVFAN